MHCAADGPVGGVPALCAKLRRVHVAQHALIEEVRDEHHVRRDTGIGAVKPRVAAAGVGEAEGESHGGEVRVYRLDLVGAEIHINGMPQRAGQLIHQAAGLAKEGVFGLLRGAGDHQRVDLTVVEKLVEYAPDKHREGRRRAESRAGGEGASYFGVKAAHVQPQLQKRRRHAAHQCLGGAEFGGVYARMIGAHVERVEALGLDMYDAAAVRLAVRVKPAVHSRCQYAAALMICMVAGKLRSAGSKYLFLQNAVLLR